MMDWEQTKASANVQFAAAHYASAAELYSRALSSLLGGEASPEFSSASFLGSLSASSASAADVAILLSNRSLCEQKLEQFGAALDDASKAVEINPRYAKAFYRRGSAHLMLGKLDEAVADFKQACVLEPNSRDARQKLAMCQKAVRQLLFQKAIEVEDAEPASLIVMDMLVKLAEPGSDYAGPRLPHRAANMSGVSGSEVVEATGMYITQEFVEAMLLWMRDEKLLPAKYVFWIVYRALELFRDLPSMLDVSVDQGAHINVCGDTHGQFYDVLNLFQLAGPPSPENPYLFNGDFVDRGSWSVEVVLSLFAYKCLYPQHVHLHRGNHETTNMNKMYGFEGEVVKKYNETLMDLFTETFNWLPLSSCLHSADDTSRVLVVHGGLFSKDGVTLDDLRQISRNQQPPDAGLMCEMLWSDPQPFPGRGPNKRGVGVAFGPDVTKEFCDTNRLDMVIRSHEVKEEGYLVEADGKLCTIFSAPNYCDQVGNKGAYIRFTCNATSAGHRLEPTYHSFDAVPHPNLKPMAYANNFSMFM